MRSRVLLLVFFATWVFFKPVYSYGQSSIKKYKVKFSKKSQNQYTTIEANNKSEAEKLLKMQYGNDIVIWIITEIK